MAAERDILHVDGLFSSPILSSSPSEYTIPGESFLILYQEWADKGYNILYPDRTVRRIFPDERGLEHRYDVLLSTFEKEAQGSDIRGMYAEIVGGLLLKNLVEQATDGEYTVLHTLPQLDINGRNTIAELSGEEEILDKTGDIMLGRVVRGGQEPVIEPIMLFDIKSSERGDKTNRKIGIGVNVGLGMSLPVGVTYLGGLPFTIQTKGSTATHPTHSYLTDVVRPAVLANDLTCLAPIRNPEAALAIPFCEELLEACEHTEGVIADTKDWRREVRKGLLDKIVVAKQAITKVYTYHYARSAS